MPGDDGRHEPAPVPLDLREAIVGIGAGYLGAPRQRPDLRPSGDAASEEKLERLAVARATIPEEFAWVTKLTSDEMRAAFPWYPLIKPGWLLRDRGDAPRIVTIVGPTSGIGKTTFGVRLMLWILDRAMLAGARETHVELAARTRFVPARELVPPAAAEMRPRLREALDARVLILDDVGKEAGESWEGRARAEQTRFLLETRFDRGRGALTVQTTYLTRDRYAAVYDGGGERRYMIQDERAGVIVYDFETIGKVLT